MGNVREGTQDWNYYWYKGNATLTQLTKSLVARQTQNDSWLNLPVRVEKNHLGHKDDWLTSIEQAKGDFLMGPILWKKIYPNWFSSKIIPRLSELFFSFRSLFQYSLTAFPKTTLLFELGLFGVFSKQFLVAFGHFN